MNGFRALAGLWLISTLLFVGLMAQRATAATNGTTAFTCKQEPGGTFTDSHCAKPGGGEFAHVGIPQGSRTEISVIKVANPFGGTYLSYTLAGITVKFFPFSISGAGWVENTLSESGEHNVNGELSLTFSQVSSEPACEIFEDVGGFTGEKWTIRTEPLALSTAGQGDRISLTPATGTVLASFWVKNCGSGFSNVEGTYTLSGSLIGTPEGATISFIHAEVTKTLKVTWPFWKELKAGFNGRLTISSRAAGGEGSYSPLSFTTIGTP